MLYDLWAVYTTYCKYNKKSLQLLDKIVKSMFYYD